MPKLIVTLEVEVDPYDPNDWEENGVEGEECPAPEDYEPDEIGRCFEGVSTGEMFAGSSVFVELREIECVAAKWKDGP